MQTVLERPADSLDSFSANLAIQEANRRKALITLAGLRRQARDEIDRLIRFLDESDLDPDLEDDASDEPSLGWTASGNCNTGVDDREADSADDEDGGDYEPSLGWTTCEAATGRHGKITRRALDLEEACDDEGQT